MLLSKLSDQKASSVWLVPLDKFCLRYWCLVRNRIIVWIFNWPFNWMIHSRFYSWSFRLIWIEFYWWEAEIYCINMLRPSPYEFMRFWIWTTRDPMGLVLIFWTKLINIFWSSGFELDHWTECQPGMHVENKKNKEVSTVKKKLMPYIFKYNQLECLNHPNLNYIKLT